MFILYRLHIKCQFVREIRRMQTGFLVTGHRPVVRVNDGFKQAHDSIAFLYALPLALKNFLCNNRKLFSRGGHFIQVFIRSTASYRHRYNLNQF